MNRLVLTGCLVEKGPLRYTPAGLAALDFGLRHESAVTHNDSVRQVSVDIKARAVGEITATLSGIELGSMRRFAGFLGSHRNGKGTIFHVTEVD